MCLWIEKIYVVKLSILPKPSMDSIQSLSRFHFFFPEGEKKIVLEFIWNQKRPRVTKEILRNNKVGALTPSFQTML